MNYLYSLTLIFIKWLCTVVSDACSTHKTEPLDILKGYRINPNGSATLDLIAASKLPSFKKTVDSLQPLPKKDLTKGA